MAVEVAEEAQAVADQLAEEVVKETILDLQDVTQCQTQAQEAAVAVQTLVVQESARLPIG